MEDRNIEQAKPGGAAIVREALENLLAWVNKHTHVFSVQVSPVHENEEAVEAELDAVKKNARRALAASARNCDRFETAQEAREAYFAWCAKFNKAVGDHKCKYACPHGRLAEKLCISCIWVWLFAPVEEPVDDSEGVP